MLDMGVAWWVNTLNPLRQLCLEHAHIVSGERARVFGCIQKESIAAASEFV